MNGSLVIGLAVGALVVAVYFKAHAAVRATAERIDRRPRQTLPGYCADCGASELTRDGRCASCQSNAIWTPGSLDLPTVAPLVNQRYAEITRRAIERNNRARGVTVSQEVN